MNLKSAIAVAVVSLVATGCATGSVSKFKGTSGNELASVSGYFGHVEPGSAADETRSGRELRYVYAWLPAAAPELGVRIMTPIGDAAKPGPTDAVAPTYRANAKSKDTFDPWLQVERCGTTQTAADLRNPCMQWQMLGENTNAADEFGGDKKNASVSISNAQPGLYRIGFGAERGTTAQGTYLIQVGSSMGGAMFGRSLAELAQQVR